MVRALISIFLFLLIIAPVRADGAADADAGSARLEANDPQTAIQLFTRAIQSKQLSQESLALTYHKRGMAFYKQGEAGRAILDYTIALWHEDLPKEFRPRTLNNRGLAFEALNHRETALRDYGLSIRLNPNYAEPYANRGNLRRKSNLNAEALMDYDMALRNGHSHPQFVFVWQGMSLEALGKPREAADSFRRALEIDPSLEDARVRLAKLEDSRVLTNAVARKRLPRGTGGPLLVSGQPGLKSQAPLGTDVPETAPWTPPAAKAPSIVRAPEAGAPSAEMGLRPAIADAPGSRTTGRPSAPPVAPELVEPAPVSPVVQPPVTAPKPDPGGEGGSDAEYVLQLGSFASEELAAAGWNRASSAARQLLDGLAHSVARVEIPQRGTMYRLYAGSLPDKDSALKLCRTLREKGSACIVVRR
jgi:tetratricopeptide (TPR) repeat protein